MVITNSIDQRPDLLDTAQSVHYRGTDCPLCSAYNQEHETSREQTETLYHRDLASGNISPLHESYHPRSQSHTLSLPRLYTDEELETILQPPWREVSLSSLEPLERWTSPESQEFSSALERMERNNFQIQWQEAFEQSREVPSAPMPSNWQHNASLFAIQVGKSAQVKLWAKAMLKELRIVALPQEQANKKQSPKGE